MKCTINNKREITGFWEDNLAPKDALDCDTGKPFHATGIPENEIYLYKLSDDGVVSPTDAGIAFETKQYQRDRLQEYPSIQECIHAILDDDLEALQAKRTAVKAKYPKPT
tara:strand:+ start:315 stop:644 length:330 start_codon:yes stop_codon:yes gene_type:complete